MASLFTAELAVLLALALSTYWILARRKKSQLPLPPGPSGLPFIGNLYDIPTIKPWEVYASWGSAYGPLMSVKAMGKTLIIVNDADIAHSIFEDSGIIYADRPRNGVIELADSKSMLVEPYGKRWRDWRRVITRTIGTPTSVRKYYPIINYHTTKLLEALATFKAGDMSVTPALRRASGAIALHFTYGWIVNHQPNVQDPFITATEEALGVFSSIFAQGKHLVEIFPPLRHFPAWLPGAGFQRRITECQRLLGLSRSVPFEWVQAQMKDGTARESLVRYLLSAGTTSEEEKDVIKTGAGAMYAAAVDTTATALSAYILAACFYPEVQRRLQNEIDRVVGIDRLPTFDDRPNLPYAQAVCKEALRWLPIVPLAFPHRATEDRIYKQYAIPKGSLIITNIWAMQHDPTKHRDPMEFRPERFLGPDPEPETWSDAFGFGKRICPGRHVVDAVLFIMVTSIAGAFKISKPTTADGEVIEPVINSSKNGILTPQDPFPCTIEPRSSAFDRLISDALATSPYEMEQSHTTGP